MATDGKSDFGLFQSDELCTIYWASESQPEVWLKSDENID